MATAVSQYLRRTVSKFQAFPSRFVFGNVSNRTKTILVTLNSI